MSIWNEYRVHCETLCISFEDSKTSEKLKKQYRALALKHHPDKGGDEETFKKVNEAHEFVLKYSSTIVEYEPKIRSNNTYQKSVYDYSDNISDNDMDRILRDWFSEYDLKRAAAQKEQYAREKWAADRKFRIRLSIEELFEGFEHTHQWVRRKNCVCSGKQHVICLACNGIGYKEDTYMSELQINSHRMNNDGDLCWYGMGDITASKSYNLVAKLEIIPGRFNIKCYSHKAPDVTTSVAVQAGSTEPVTISTLEGDVIVKLPKNTRDNSVIRLKERGLIFNRDGKRFRSDLLVTIKKYI